MAFFKNLSKLSVMNLDMIFGLGVLGGIILVFGAMWTAKKVKIPRYSTKNWLFATTHSL